MKLGPKALTHVTNCIKQAKYRLANELMVSVDTPTLKYCLQADPQLITHTFASPKWCKQYGDLATQLTDRDLLTQTSDYLCGHSVVTLTKLVHIMPPMSEEQLQEVVLADKNGTVTLLLHAVQDPYTLGACIQAAEWCGVRRIVCKDCTDLTHPAVAEGSAGAIYRNVSVHKINSARRLLEGLETLPTFGVHPNGMDCWRQSKPKDTPYLVIVSGTQLNSTEEFEGAVDTWVSVLPRQQVPLPSVATGVALQALVGEDENSVDEQTVVQDFLDTQALVEQEKPEEDTVPQKKKAWQLPRMDDCPNLVVGGRKRRPPKVNPFAKIRKVQAARRMLQAIKRRKRSIRRQ
eukprot:TRINITY_DN89288_c0_g1_i1.p1 TRINITY_DN89288_c0_g1~~TRINITY_DN89288_c0_g1_i1.p1  ORF type:complete len:347 (+),score=21.85 TRINITY_DN89288_c0_g1_i1:46-1086(+)